MPLMRFHWPLSNKSNNEWNYHDFSPGKNRFPLAWHLDMINLYPIPIMGPCLDLNVKSSPNLAQAYIKRGTKGYSDLVLTMVCYWMLWGMADWQYQLSGRHGVLLEIWLIALLFEAEKPNVTESGYRGVKGCLHGEKQCIRFLGENLKKKNSYS